MESSSLRLWFVSDIHASNACFRKFINLIDNPNKPNVLIIGGDITGKHTVCIVERAKGYSVERVDGSSIIARGELADVKSELEDSGCYVYLCDETQFEQFKLSKISRQQISDRLARERLQEWVDYADRKLKGRTDCKVFINAGNDDPPYVDEVLDTSETMTRPEGKVIELPGGMKLISTGYSNMSPWNCPRDEAEDALLERILTMTALLRDSDRSRTIFNLHCPPHNTLLDLAPELDKDTFRKIAGPKGPALKHVGSTAVRRAIESFQPVVSLHGHIHTGTGVDRIGRTVCFNPGSDYSSGTLQGVFLVFDKEGRLVFDRLTSEREALHRKPVAKNWLERALTILASPYRHFSADEKDAMAERPNGGKKNARQ